jgi:hypothetical protein
MQEKDYCDRNIIRRKPSGIGWDTVKEFLPYNGGNEGGLLPKSW